MGLHSFSVTCLAWGDSVLESTGSTGYWWPLRGLMPKDTSQNACCLCPHHCVEQLLTHTSVRDPPPLTGRSGSVFYGVIIHFPWVLVCTRFCLRPLRVESLFLQVLRKSWNPILLASKPEFLGISCPFARYPDWEAWSRAHNLYKFFDATILQVMCHPPKSYGIWFHHDCIPPTISLWLLFCLWV